MARRAAYDYVVVGGGFAGLNAVSGLQKFRPAASILCIDKHDAAGGSWNDYYSFCKLHAPHPTFGIAGHGWPGLASPNLLATLDERRERRGSGVRRFARGRRGARRETLYVVVGGGKTGADAVCFLGEHRRTGDDVLLVTGSSKGFFVRDEVFPDQGSQSVFQPMITEVMLDMIAAWDGTDASERDILNDMVARGTLCSLGGSEVANTGLGVLSLAEQAAVEATAAIVANDHYVGVSARGATTEVRLASGGAIVTRKRVVVVNARSSGSDRVHAYNSDVHPMRPEGHLDFGALAGFTGHTNYLFSAVLAKHGSPRVLEDLALYGRRTRARPRENFVFAYLVKVYANITALMPALEMKHYLSSDYSINATRWYPTARRLHGVYRLLQSRDAVAAMADAHLRRLEPGDAQPPPEGA
ncbi:pyridine nucleotide-disulfide oxidoreductase [Aureococcus anophagefferens]|nr:pyridine nucleotide-disulfide oxidoreductase [Aureococcus anophagefferens]